MIGIYGGTFDPIHLGHISLALDMLEKRQLEEIWFCPVGISPHKKHLPPVSTEHRMQMLQLAIKEIPQFKILDVETKRNGPSYTIDTLRDVLAAEKNQVDPRQFSFILGDDAIRNFCNWHQPEEIVKLVPLFIGRRQHSPFDFKDFKGNDQVKQALIKGMTNTRLLEISGTEIRERLDKGLYCGHLLPAKVLDYIYANQLYSKR